MGNMGDGNMHRTLWAAATTDTGSSPAGANDYPPARTGLRGNHDGAYEVAHALAWDGKSPAHYAALDDARAVGRLAAKRAHLGRHLYKWTVPEVGGPSRAVSACSGKTH